MSVERLTERLENGVINVKYASQHETAIHRLVTIEDILGDEYDLDELREMVQAKREGRCVVLPCKPGNTVWSANVFGVSSHVIRRIELNQDGDSACSMLMFPFEDFGNKVFLTREAAEAAMKERKKDES